MKTAIIVTSAAVAVAAATCLAAFLLKKRGEKYVKDKYSYRRYTK